MTEKIQAKVLESYCVLDLSGRKANLAANIANGHPSAVPLPAREGKLAICGAGPSLADRLDILKDWDGEVWAINGAYDWFLENGLVPDGFFGIDPLPTLVEYIENIQPETTLYIGSTCDPGVLNKAKSRGCDVLMFHHACEDQNIYPEGTRVVPGGTTAVTRAPYAGLMLGWRDITAFGVDCSYGETSPYCYTWGSYKEDIKDPIHRVMLGKEGPFFADTGLLKQCSQLWVMLGLLNSKFPNTFKIDKAGLMGAFLDSPMCDDSNIEIVPNDPDNGTAANQAAA